MRFFLSGGDHQSCNETETKKCQVHICYRRNWVIDVRTRSVFFHYRCAATIITYDSKVEVTTAPSQLSTNGIYIFMKTQEARNKKRRSANKKESDRRTLAHIATPLHWIFFLHCFIRFMHKIRGVFFFFFGNYNQITWQTKCDFNILFINLLKCCTMHAFASINDNTFKSDLVTVWNYSK